MFSLKNIPLLRALTILIIATININAQTTYVWDGGAGTNNWTDDDNWNPNGQPGTNPGDEVQITIATTVNLSGVNPTIRRLSLNDNASASLTIESDVTLTVDGSTSDGIRVEQGTLINNGTIIIQNIGNGGSDNGIDVRTTFDNYGAITINGTTDDGVVVFNGALFNNRSGASLTINNAGDFGILIDTSATPSTFNNDGTITITNAQDDAIRLETGTLNNNAPNGTIDINTPADLGISILRLGDLNNSGTIDIFGAAARYGIELFNDSQIATLDNLNGGIINITSSALDGLRVDNGTTVNNDGEIIINTSGTVDINRISGSIFNNTFNAVFRPGASPGTLFISDDFNFGASTYNCEINGTTSSSQYDNINITGTGTVVNGSTKLNLAFGYSATINDSFDIITAGTLSGTIANGDISIDNIGNGNVDAVDVTYLPNGIRVTVTSVNTLETETNNTFSEKIHLINNPTAEKVDIELENTYTNITIALVNVMGQTILNQEFENTNTISFNIDGPSGIYFLNVLNEEGNFTTLKIIKK